MRVTDQSLFLTSPNFKFPSNLKMTCSIVYASDVSMTWHNKHISISEAYIKLLPSFSLIIVIVSGFHPCRVGPCLQNTDTNKNINFATTIAATQRRWASRSAAEEDNRISIGPRKGREVEENEKDNAVVYYGPISSTIKKVKLLSLSTCCLSVSLGPVITFMTSPDMNVILKGAVASSVIFLSATTTAALHWFVSPYIHKLKWQPGSDTFDVEMLSWLASHIPKTIKFADIKLPDTNRPYVTFKANGNFYFVDAEHCHNKALLARLTPQKGSQESAFKNL